MIKNFFLFLVFFLFFNGCVNTRQNTKQDYFASPLRVRNVKILLIELFTNSNLIKGVCKEANDTIFIVSPSEKIHSSRYGYKLQKNKKMMSIDSGYSFALSELRVRVNSIESMGGHVIFAGDTLKQIPNLKKSVPVFLSHNTVRNFILFEP